jgi:A/G-specific adenine glycosylase
MTTAKFQRIIWNYYRVHRRDLPWRNTRDPYRILVSEVMLQQTQVVRVLLYYDRFLRELPDFRTLSRTPLDRILRVWQGLGYNRRALYLKKLATVVMKKYGGILPRDPTLLAELPGIGNTTAGAIAAFAFNVAIPFIETNIRRVFIHFFFPRREKVADGAIIKPVEDAMDRKNPREWYYALMDYGAMLGKKKENPNKRSRQYRRQPQFRGSRRELRGKLIKLLVAQKSVATPMLARLLSASSQNCDEAIRHLKKEGVIREKRGSIRIV